MNQKQFLFPFAIIAKVLVPELLSIKTKVHMNLLK